MPVTSYLSFWCVCDLMTLKHQYNRHYLNRYINIFITGAVLLQTIVGGRGGSQAPYCFRYDVERHRRKPARGVSSHWAVRYHVERYAGQCCKRPCFLRLNYLLVCCYTYYRLISVKTISSRVAERYIVRTFIKLPADSLSQEFYILPLFF